MKLPVIALFSRTLRQESREFKTYALRLALVVTITFGLSAAAFSGRSAPGLTFFITTVFINFLFITLVGCSYFSSVITEEKEDLTLGLLKMTSLSPVSILLGKSTSKVIGALFLLLVQLPFTMFAMTLGGVSLSQIAASYLTLGAYVVFLSNLALFCSVICKSSRRAAYLTGFFLMFFFFAPTLWGPVVLQWLTPAPPAGPSLVLNALTTLFGLISDASPAAQIQKIMATGFSGPLFSYQVVSNIVLGAAFFLLAWRSFGYFTREQKEIGPGRGILPRRSSRLKFFGAGRAWSWPLAWKDFHFLAGGKIAFILKFPLLGSVIAFIAYFTSEVARQKVDLKTLGAITMITSVIAICAELGFYASRLFREEVRWKTLPTIMVLPGPLGKIVFQKIAGNLLCMIPSILFFIAGFLMSPQSLFIALREMARSGVLLLGICMLILFLYLTVLLSLFLRRGALGVSFIIVYICSGFFALPAVLGGVSGTLISFVCLIASSVGFHIAIRARLYRLAGQ
jgi:ABC-type transport system involved in multi-copper enzyme maturation permease subunit